MNLTISEFAKSKGVSYESVRKQVSKREDELKDHIIIENGKKVLTDQAQEILNGKKPVVIVQDKNLQDKEYQEKLDEKDKRIEELEKQLEEIELKSQNEILRIENETLKKVREIEKIANNSQLLLEQKDKEKTDLEQKKDNEIKLMATNRQARREYKKELKRKAKEEKKQAKQNI